MYTLPSRINRYTVGSATGGGGTNRYAAGKPAYGGGRPMPNIGAVSGSGKMGYAVRDRLHKSRQNLALQRMRVNNARQMGMS